MAPEWRLTFSLCWDRSINEFTLLALKVKAASERGGKGKLCRCKELNVHSFSETLNNDMLFLHKLHHSVNKIQQEKRHHGGSRVSSFKKTLHLLRH